MIRPSRKRRASVGTYVEPPLAPLAPIERVVEEGAIIYVSSTRMTVKNQLIVAALGEHRDYEPEALRAAVRAELERLAADNDDTADRLDGAAADQVEYEAELDDALLRQKREDHARRPRVLRLIAEGLRERALSDELVLALVDQARADAVEEMFRAIDSRLSDDVVPMDADYDEQRAQRISDFVAFDLLGGVEEPDVTPPARKAKRRR